MTALGPEAVVVATFGLIVGSFLNVVVHRVPRRLSVVVPRSRCPGCASLIPWYHNVPVLSYLALGGRCGTCRTRIAARYPLTEAATAALAVVFWLRFGPTAAFLLLTAYGLAMIALFLIDLELRLLPFAITDKGTALGILAAPWNPWTARTGERLLWALDLDGGRAGAMLAAVATAVLGAGLGYGLLKGLMVGYKLWRGVEGLGGGDPRMAAMIGAFSGPRGVITVLILASLIGTALGLGLILLRRANMQSALPFGCFLAPAAVLVVLLGPDELWLQWQLLTAGIVDRFGSARGPGA